jgi:hypothetical protein
VCTSNLYKNQVFRVVYYLSNLTSTHELSISTATSSAGFPTYIVSVSVVTRIQGFLKVGGGPVGLEGRVGVGVPVPDLMIRMRMSVDETYDSFLASTHNS